jgi:hypothetical protein
LLAHLQVWRIRPSCTGPRNDRGKCCRWRLIADSNDERYRRPNHCLPMQIDLISEAGSALGIRLNARSAERYLQALYDLQHIQPGNLRNTLKKSTV